MRASKKLPKDLQIWKLDIVSKSSWWGSITNDSMIDLDPTSVPKIQKPKLRVKKPRESDIKWSNPCGDQATHFNDCTKILNLENFSYNHKKIITTSDARPTICVSSYQQRGNSSKMSYCYKAKSAKVSQSK